MEDLCERPRKLKHKELRSQYLDTVTYKDIRKISRNMHKARSSQLLALPTDTEETHEALSAVEVRQILLVNDSGKKTVVMFTCKNNVQFLAPLMGFTLTGHSYQHRSFSTNYLQFIHSLRATCIFYRPINIQRPMRMCQPYGIRGCKIWCECFSNNCLC